MYKLAAHPVNHLDIGLAECMSRLPYGIGRRSVLGVHAAPYERYLVPAPCRPTGGTKSRSMCSDDEVRVRGHV